MQICKPQRRQHRATRSVRPQKHANEPCSRADIVHVVFYARGHVLGAVVPWRSGMWSLGGGTDSISGSLHNGVGKDPPICGGRLAWGLLGSLGWFGHEVGDLGGCAGRGRLSHCSACGNRICWVSFTAAYRFSSFLPSRSQIPCMSSLAQSLTVRSRPQDAMNLASSVTSAASTVPS
jgi:hypothetical protein